MRPGFIWAVFTKEARDLFSNRLLLGAVALPALIFASIPTGIVAFIEVNELDPGQMARSSATLASSPSCRRSSLRRDSSS